MFCIIITLNNNNIMIEQFIALNEPIKLEIIYYYDI